MAGITSTQARQMAEAMLPSVAIAKNALGGWAVTLTEAELAALLTKAGTHSTTRLLNALDCMDHGCREPGWRGHENGLGDEKAGDELQEAMEELVLLVGHEKVPEPVYED